MSKLCTRTCNVCHQTFVRDQSGRKARICSKDCERKWRTEVGKKNTKRTERTCQRCGAKFMAPPCRIRTYCSRACKHADLPAKNTGIVRTSKTLPCGFCGKPVKQFKSRAHLKLKFCNADCYHAWDSLYKQTPAMKRKQALRMIAMGGKPSGIEVRVAEWLTSHGIQFEQQVKVHYSLIDFKVGDTLIEVNGCYWHACAEHFPMITPTQQKRITRDKQLTTYCRNRSIPFLVIWEHDIRRNDFSVLADLIRIV